EERGVRADAERERKNGGRGKPRIQAKQALSVTQVLPKRFEKAQAVHAIDLLANDGDVAKFAARGVAGVGKGHAARDVLFGLDFDVRIDFAAALGVPPVAAEEPEEASVEFRLHGASPRLDRERDAGRGRWRGRAAPNGRFGARAGGGLRA